MTKIVQDLAPQILEEIKKAHRVLLHCHPRPDPDSIGGVLATMHVLEAMGKEVTAIRGDSEASLPFSVLPGFEKIVPKNFFEIDLSEFDLFIILDSGGIDRISSVAPVVFPEHLQTISIDHHPIENFFAKINLVDPTSPATCYVLYELFSFWGVTITPDIAKCLILGIYSDTGNLRYSNTTSETLASVARLSEIAPDFTSVISLMDNSNTPGVLAYWSLALSSITLHCKNHVAISAVSYSALQEKGISKTELFLDIANILKSVIGWEIGVKMVEDRQGGVKISFRTRNARVYDVSKIAIALGGGGHKAAAAADLKATLDEAVKKVVETIGSIYPELAE